MGLLGQTGVEEMGLLRKFVDEMGVDQMGVDQMGCYHTNYGLFEKGLNLSTKI